MLNTYFIFLILWKKKKSFILINEKIKETFHSFIQMKDKRWAGLTLRH